MKERKEKGNLPLLEAVDVSFRFDLSRGGIGRGLESETTLRAEENSLFRV